MRQPARKAVKSAPGDSVTRQNYASVCSEISFHSTNCTQIYLKFVGENALSHNKKNKKKTSLVDDNIQIFHSL